MRTPTTAWFGARGLNSVGLSIVGYEYAALVPADKHDWDANWLTVDGRVQTPTRNWSFRHPCLTTWEVAALVVWLEDTAAVKAVDALEFTEPLLRFEIGQVQPGGVNLCLRLKGEALPSSEYSKEIRWGSGVVLQMPMDFHALREAGGSLREQLAAFPQR